MPMSILFDQNCSHYCLKESLKGKQLLQNICAIRRGFKNAKKFHNCIWEPFYNIPLTQVRINVNNVYKANRTSCFFVFFS